MSEQICIRIGEINKKFSKVAELDCRIDLIEKKLKKMKLFTSHHIEEYYKFGEGGIANICKLGFNFDLCFKPKIERCKIYWTAEKGWFN